MKLKIFVLLTSIVFLLIGCSQIPEDAAEEVLIPLTKTSLPPTPTATFTPVPPTSTLTPTTTSTFTPSPYPTGTMSALVSVASLNLRSGPGTVHEVLSAYPEDTQLNVLGIAPGNEWVEVELEDGETGWMSVGLLEFERDFSSLPLLDDLNSQLVTGKVIDSSAESISDIQVSVFLRLADSTLRTDAATNQEGFFYAYLPEGFAGNWEVEITAIGCESRIVNDRCNLQGYFIYNSYTLVGLPQTSPLIFMYETASTEIHGFVEDQKGDPLSIRVFAIRNDGAYAYSVSSTSGEFFIPASDGNWKVYAVLYTPYLEGESVEVEVTGGVLAEDLKIIAPQPE